MASNPVRHVAVDGTVTYRVSWRNAGTRQTKAVSNLKDAKRLKGAIESRGGRVNATDDEVISGSIYGRGVPTTASTLAPMWPDVVAEWRDQIGGQRPQTLALYERSIRLHLSRWDDLRVDQITRPLVMAFVRDYAMVKGGTGHGHLKVAQAVLRFAERREYIAESPARKVKFVTEAAPQHTFWTVAEVAAMEAVLTDPEAKVSPQVATIVALMLGTGLRINEACGLRRGDLSNLDTAKPLLEVRRSVSRKAGVALGDGPTKSGKPRTITLGPAITAMLVAWLETVPSSDDAWLFPRAKHPDEPMPDDVVRCAFAKVLDRMVATRVLDPSRLGRLHDLRHTHASRLNQRGCSLLYISKRLGHASVLETQRAYVSFGQDGDEAEMAALD